MSLTSLPPSVYHTNIVYAYTIQVSSDSSPTDLTGELSHLASSAAFGDLMRLHMVASKPS